LFNSSRKKYLSGRFFPEYDLSHFRRPSEGGQMSLEF
jgi:hypothetical protein